MVISRRRELTFLVIGDLFFLSVSLALMLLIRFTDKLDEYLVVNHILPFAILFALSLLLFYIAGLYDKQTVVFKKKLPQIIINAQIANAFLAVLLFYFVPEFVITPKVSLFLYLAISSVLIISWRFVTTYIFRSKKKYTAIVIGKGTETDELVHELNNNNRYDIYIPLVIDPEVTPIRATHIRAQVPDLSLVVVDVANSGVQDSSAELYSLIFSGVRFIDLSNLYEDVFNRIPLSIISYEWFIRNASQQEKPVYDAVKRLIDVCLALPFAILTLLLYPFVWLGTKISDGGPLFFTQDRVGKGGKIFKIWKFRSMTSDHRVTRFGALLRTSRIDELPQLWSVVKGDQSLVGPRPEKPDYVVQYDKEIPYYNVRHIISPGLSGWAQIYHDNHPHHAISEGQTREKLSFDLYYIKHRSFGLDVSIALKTFKILVSFVGK